MTKINNYYFYIRNNIRSLQNFMLIDYLPWLVGAVEWTGSIEGNRKINMTIKCIMHSIQN